MSATSSRRTLTLVAAISIGGGALLAATIWIFPLTHITTATWHRALVLLAVTAVAEFVSINFHHGDQTERLTLFELAIVADIVLLPPALAAFVSLGGLAIVLVARGKVKEPIKFAFNLGQYALGIAPAIGLYHGVGGGHFQTSAGLLALFAGMSLFTISNLVTISAIISATTDRPYARVLREESLISLAIGVGNSAVGMVAVSLYLTRPALLPAVLAPAAALQLAFRGWVQAQELQRAMADETAKLGRILEHSSEGIVLADADGSVLLWSPSMERSTGVSANEAVGKALSYLLRGRDVYGRSISIEVSGRSEPVEFEIVAVDGKPRWLRVQHGPGFDEDGALSFDVLVVTDVTRQREVDRLKEDFFSTVSHELRTPLTPIKGYTTLLLRRSDDIPPERRKEALQSILERTDHMARLVEDLLLASRMVNTDERRMPEIPRKPVDVPSVVERALRSFRIAHPSREFVVRADEIPHVSGDPIRVEQIVANLVSNAIKFSEDGTLVDIALTADDDEVSIEVTDEGRGIPADRYEEIFERFKRLEDPLVMETGGAGLGLFIVRELARAMGGSATVRSEVGTGSTFTVKLPVVGSGEQAIPQRRDRDAAG